MESPDKDLLPVEELIKGCIRKDRRAWDILVERYSKVVYWAIRDRLKRFGYNFEEEDLNDIHQDVFIALWAGDKFSQLKDKTKLAGWLAMVAGNTAIDYFKKMKRQSPPNSISIYKEIYPDGGDGAKTLEELLPAKDTDPAKPLMIEDIRRVIEEEIGALKPREKMVIKLDLFRGMKHKEIAESLGIPIDTVSTTIARTKDELRRRLKQKNI